jgi:hypothetical protein
MSSDPSIVTDDPVRLPGSRKSRDHQARWSVVDPIEMTPFLEGNVRGEGPFLDEKGPPPMTQATHGDSALVSGSSAVGGMRAGWNGFSRGPGGSENGKHLLGFSASTFRTVHRLLRACRYNAFELLSASVAFEFKYWHYFPSIVLGA